MKYSRYTYTITELVEAVKASTSYAQALTRLGLVASGGAYSSIRKNIEEHKIDTSHFLGQGWLRGQPARKYTEINLQEILEGLHPHYGSYALKRRLIRAGIFKHQCYECLLTEWNGQPIPIELEHINGIKTDHRLVNLTVLCPNCHAQTPTHAGKNIGSARRTRTDTPSREPDFVE